MVYLPDGGETTVDFNLLVSPAYSAWWLDPTNGDAHMVGEFSGRDMVVFASPSMDGPDGLLVLDVIRQ
jgi:hypothetical protein